MNVSMPSESHPMRVERIEGSVMAVNSYIVEGPDGVVVVDGQLAVSDAHAVRRAIDDFGRPVAGLVVTHGHPDHYAGAAVILDGLAAPIIATAAVADVIARDDSEKDAIVGPMMGDEWPTSRRFVDEIVEPSSIVGLAGLEFAVRGLGPGESHEDSLWTVGAELVFSGDVAYNNMHAYLLDGHLDEWLSLLDRLEREIDRQATLYVGHGDPTDRSVLARQRTYIHAFVDAVTQHLDAEADRRRYAVVSAMRQLVADERLEFLMELSIEPAADVLRSKGRQGGWIA